MYVSHAVRLIVSIFSVKMRGKIIEFLMREHKRGAFFNKGKERLTFFYVPQKVLPPLFLEQLITTETKFES